MRLQTWSPVWDLLREDGHRIIAVDLPGSGPGSFAMRRDEKRLFEDMIGLETRSLSLCPSTYPFPSPCASLSLSPSLSIIHLHLHLSRSLPLLYKQNAQLYTKPPLKTKLLFASKSSRRCGVVYEQIRSWGHNIAVWEQLTLCSPLCAVISVVLVLCSTRAPASASELPGMERAT